MRRAYPNLESPIQRMRKLHADGEAYWLEDIRFTSGVIKCATVHAIGAYWIEVQEEGSDQLIWIHTNHIVSLKIVEG